MSERHSDRAEDTLTNEQIQALEDEVWFYEGDLPEDEEDAAPVLHGPRCMCFVCDPDGARDLALELTTPA